MKLLFRGGLDVPAQAQDDAFARNFFFEQREHFIQSRHPRGGVNFQHERRVVLIQHESRPAVALAVDEPVAGGRRIKKSFAPRKCLREACLPPCRVNRPRLARVQNADADGRIGIEQADGEKFVFAVEYDRQFAKLSGAIGFMNAVGKKPRMPSAHDGFRRRCDAQTEAGGRSLSCGGRIHSNPQFFRARFRTVCASVRAFVAPAARTLLT